MKFAGSALSVVGKIDEGLVKNLGTFLLADPTLKTPAGFNYHTTALSDDSKIPWWCRIDASLRQDNLYTHNYYNKVSPLLSQLENLDLPILRGSTLYSWSISRLSPKTKLEDHTDGILRFRFCDRLIVPLSVNEFSYNYTVKSGVRTEVRFEIGCVYRLNNLEIHGAVNDGDIPRDNLLLDFIDLRLWEKFKNHPDMFSLISPKSSEVDSQFFRKLLAGEARSKGD